MSNSIHQKINKQIVLALQKLGADIELLCIVGSYHETQSDSDILEMLEQYNANGSCVHSFIAPQVIFTPTTGYIGKPKEAKGDE